MPPKVRQITYKHTSCRHVASGEPPRAHPIRPGIEDATGQNDVTKPEFVVLGRLGGPRSHTIWNEAESGHINCDGHTSDFRTALPMVPTAVRPSSEIPRPHVHTLTHAQSHISNLRDRAAPPHMYPTAIARHPPSLRMRAQITEDLGR